MARSPIIFRLNDPGFTIYHRAALGGLAATILSWEPSKIGVQGPLIYQPRSSFAGCLTDADGTAVKVDVDAKTIELSWAEPTTDRKAIALLLRASFRRTDDGLIDLPGLGFGPGREDVRLGIHNALTQTFLQHNKKRPGTGIGYIPLKIEDQTEHVFSFKKIDHYSHQVAQGTGLLGDGWNVEPGEIPELSALSQALLPGAMKGAADLVTSAKHAFLLHYLMVASPVFLIRSRKREAKTQSCLIVPDVTDLKSFARSLLGLGADTIQCYSNSYGGRVAGGGEEAALKFLMDLRSHKAAEGMGVTSFQVFAMGKIAWDKKQQNRSWIARIDVPDLDRKEFGVFEAAAQYLGKPRTAKNKKGESFCVPVSNVPDLVAANLASDEHWCAHFTELVSNKKDFRQFIYQFKGLRAMSDAVRDPDDRLIISCFHASWDAARAGFSDRATRENTGSTGYWNLVERKRERIRNDILRCKTVDFLTNWLLRFAADSSRDVGLEIFRSKTNDLQRVLFGQRSPERLQNLLLFSLVSASSFDPRDRYQPIPKDE